MFDPNAGEIITEQQAQELLRSQNQIPDENVSDVSQFADMAQENKPDFNAFIKQSLESRRANFQAAVQAQSKDKQTGLETAFQGLGQGIGFAGDVVGTALIPSKDSLLGQIISMAKENPTPFAQNLAKQFSALGELYKNWAAKPENQRTARNLEAAVPIASLLLGGTAAGQAAEDVVSGAVKIGTKAFGEISAETGALAEKETQKAIMSNVGKIKGIPTKTERIAAAEKAGMPGGITVTKKGVEIMPTAREMEIGKQIQETGILKNTRNAAERNLVINKEIGRMAEEDVRPYLKANPRIFNEKTFAKYIDDYTSAQTKTISEESPAYAKKYQAVKQRAIDILSQNKHDMEGVWDARQGLDRLAKEESKTAFDEGSKKVIDLAIKNVREGMNQFIDEQIGTKEFTNKMRQLNNLYIARENIAEQIEAQKLIGSKKFDLWARNNPKTAKTLKIALRSGEIGAALWGGNKILDYLRKIIP